MLVNTTMEIKSASTLTFMDEVETFTTFKIASFIGTYWLPTLVPVGLVGNTLSFLVMNKPNNRKKSTCIFMTAISVNDNFMMFLAFYTWLIEGLKIHEWDEIECKSFAFLVLLTLQNTTYQVLAMTIDKYVAIKWPHKAAIYSTPKRAKVTVILIYVCVFIYNSPHLVFSSIIGSQCLGYVKGGFITKIYSWLTFVLNAIIPFSLLIHMNYVIINRVNQSRKMFVREEINVVETQDNKRQLAMKNAENQLTIMLLLVTTLFLVLLIPTYVRFMYLTFVKIDSPEKYATLMLFYHITNKLYFSNNGINFFLYCVSGQKFRNDLKEILCHRRKNVFNSTSSITEVSLVDEPTDQNIKE